MLELTILSLRREASFAGAWIRPRSQMPVSFSDKALARFKSEMSIDEPVTRNVLKENANLYTKYIVWWNGKRKAFFTSMRDYLRGNGVDDAFILYTGCPGEPGVSFHSWDERLITDRPDLWKSIVQRPEHLDPNRGPMTLLGVPQVVGENLYLDGLLSTGLNWGNWELHHSRPADDPQNYKDVDGVLLSHAFNRNYTVASPKTFDAFRAPQGLAIIRHYALNENMMFDKTDKNILGYFVADFEQAGPYCMMREALAMANGDPTMIGYLVGCNFGRGFPKYVRNFNANFLALPARPSRVVSSAASDPEVVVRQIDTKEYGTWVAVVNTSLESKQGVSIAMPSGRVTAAVSCEEVSALEGRITLDMYPCQLRSFRVQ
jgi:hypothetical protein